MALDKDTKLTISEPSYGTLLTQHRIALNALRCIVSEADAPNRLPLGQAYCEAVETARSALKAVTQ